MSPYAPRGYEGFSDFVCEDPDGFQEYWSGISQDATLLGSSRCFSQDQTGVTMVLGEKDHKDKMPLSPHHIKGISAGLSALDVPRDHLMEAALVRFAPAFFLKNNDGQK